MGSGLLFAIRYQIVVCLELLRCGSERSIFLHLPPPSIVTKTYAGDTDAHKVESSFKNPNSTPDPVVMLFESGKTAAPC